MIPRRIRRLRLIDTFGSRQRSDALATLLVRHGLDILSDRGVELLAREMVENWAWSRRNNKRNRAIRARMLARASEAGAV
jgi:hypothetical protein